MADAQVLIGQIVLSAGLTQVSFTNIPTSVYTDLVLVAKIANSGNSSAGRLRFNGDSGANYNGIWMGGQGSSTASGSEANETGGRVIGYSTGPTTGWANFSLTVQGAFSTDKHKTAVSKFSDAGGDVMATVTRWASTSPITSLTIYDVLGQTYVAGSTFSLYGVVA
jgi:hypothetical protein